MSQGKARKAAQLGMDPATAHNRLIKALLFDLVIRAGHVCCRCGRELDRETFSVDHLTPWLDSADPRGLFFSLSNIGFSHLGCNIADGRRPFRYTAAAIAAMTPRLQLRLARQRRKAARRRAKRLAKAQQ